MEPLCPWTLQPKLGSRTSLLHGNSLLPRDEIMEVYEKKDRPFLSKDALTKAGTPTLFSVGGVMPKISLIRDLPKGPSCLQRL